MVRELALHDPDWEARLAAGGGAADAILRRVKPFHAHRILRPYLEAYRVVADALEQRAQGAALDGPAFLEECLARGQQYRLQHRIHGGESVSRVLFESALKLARNRGLVGAGGPEGIAGRRAFAAAVQPFPRAMAGRFWPSCGEPWTPSSPSESCLPGAGPR